MIIKDYFADGLLQIAIVLSLLRCDLDSFVGTSVRPLLGQSHLLETNIGPLSSITRTGLNFHSREFVREYPKVLDSYSDRFTAVLRDLHSLNYYRRFDGISTNVYAWLVNDGGPGGATSSSEPSAGNSADESNTASHNVSPLPTAELSVVAPEPNNMNLFLADDLSKEVDYVQCFKCSYCIFVCCETFIQNINCTCSSKNVIILYDLVAVLPLVI